MLENLKPAERIDAPKDFRAALEFDGQNGTATLPAGSTDWEAFLVEQGFDPAEYEIVGSPRTSRWQKYDGEWLTSYRFNFRKLVNSDLDLSLIWKIAKKSNLKKSDNKLIKSDKALVLMLADFQIGKTDHRGGHAEQLERIMSVYDQLERRFKAGKYEQIILADMGDIVENFNNKADMNQLATNSMSIMDQVDVTVSLIWELIQRANKYTNKVIYASVASNHCQNRINKQQVGMPGNDDWGIFIAKQVNRLATLTGIDVTCLIPNQQDESLAFDVWGDGVHILGLWHGHQYNRPDSAISWWQKQTFGKQPVSAANIGLSGHFHHLRIEEAGSGRYWIQGKTLDNGSNWWRLNSGSDSIPGITCFELIKGLPYQGEVSNVIATQKGSE